MKGLLVVLVVLAGVWFWRSRATAINRRPPSAPTPTPQDTVACSHCHVHIPRAEAIQGQHGSYCGLEHLHQSEP